MGAFSTAFLAGSAQARSFLSLDFRDADARRAKAREASGRRIAPELLALLREQNAPATANGAGLGLPPSAARAANVEALASGAAAVVTGQQAGLFLGPLYTFYKAASAIATAAAIERESGVRCVPVFWLQTEDHDFAEIDHCRLAGADGEPVKIALAPGRAGEARISIRHRRLGDDVGEALAAAEQALGTLPHAAEAIALLRAHYVPGRSIAAAFAGVLATLFADEGLVFLDPREVTVARLAAPLYRKAIADEAAISRLLDERRTALADAGFDEQVHTRPGCSLVCFHEGSALGPRFRLERRRDEIGWCTAGGTRGVSEVDIAAALDHDPLRFSTTALLRPLVQDTILPVAAYVGGPAEMSYFAQIGPLYRFFDLPQPLPLPRARFRCVDAKTRGRLDTYHLRCEDVERPWGDLVSKVAGSLVNPGAGANPDADPARLGADVAAAALCALEPLEKAALAADPNLARPVARTRDGIAHAIGRLAEKHRRALVERDAIVTRRLERLQAMLYPLGMPQERCYGWPSFAARVGAAPFKKAVMDALVPFTFSPIDIAL